MDDFPSNSRESAIDHLEEALNAKTLEDKNIHIRQALQYLHGEE